GDVLPCYGNASTERSLRERYAYAFAGTPWIGAIPHLTFQVATEPFELFGVRLSPIPLQHGRVASCGWRVGDVAYLTDTNGIPPESARALRGLDLVVIDALRFRPHRTPSSIAAA